MNKQRRLTIIILVVVLILGILIGNIIIPAITSNSEISVFRTSPKNLNHAILVYENFVKSTKHPTIQSEPQTSYTSEFQYIIDVKCDYDNISVSTYSSDAKEWHSRTIRELGNDQYAITALTVFHRTVTYCISIQKGENVKKYYFTAKSR